MTQEIHTYLHCKRCLGAWQTERLEVGFTAQGLLLHCRKHGQVALFTPEQVAERIARPPECDCCAGSKAPPAAIKPAGARASGATRRAQSPPTAGKRG